MNQDMSILHLILGASVVVQLVMLLLLVVSIASWAAIFRKMFSLIRVKALNESFEREFWSGTSLNDLYAAAAQNARGQSEGICAYLAQVAENWWFSKVSRYRSAPVSREFYCTCEGH